MVGKGVHWRLGKEGSRQWKDGCCKDRGGRGLGGRCWMIAIVLRGKLRVMVGYSACFDNYAGFTVLIYLNHFLISIIIS